MSFKTRNTIVRVFRDNWMSGMWENMCCFGLMHYTVIGWPVCCAFRCYRDCGGRCPGKLADCWSDSGRFFSKLHRESSFPDVPGRRRRPPAHRRDLGLRDPVPPAASLRDDQAGACPAPGSEQRSDRLLDAFRGKAASIEGRPLLDARRGIILPPQALWCKGYSRAGICQGLLAHNHRHW